MTRVTMQQVADAVGVTKMTVSNAYSRPERLSPGMRERILATAAELGYAGPDATARALARGRSGVVGVLLTDSPLEAFVDEVAVEFMATIARGLSTRALSMTLLAASRTPELVPARDLPMDGVVVYGCSADSEALGVVLERRLPTVIVDQALVEGTSSVNIDDRGGARAAAAHLHALGHRRVAAISPAPVAGYRGHTTERLQGWREGLDGGRLDAVTVAGTLSAADGAALARDLLSGPHPPTAVLCFSDTIAAGVLEAADQLGVRVPGDLSVVGFDDSPLAVRLGLTTVRQDVTTKGEAVVEALLRAMDARAADRPLPVARTQLPTELVVRTSTGPVTPEEPPAPARRSRRAGAPTSP
ncbi:MAG: LacI family DNA-binding transcriptional regulator [Oryzihumus sp.]